MLYVYLQELKWCKNMRYRDKINRTIIGVYNQMTVQVYFSEIVTIAVSAVVAVTRDSIKTIFQMVKPKNNRECQV